MGVGSDPKIGNVLVQGCTNGGLRIESRSGGQMYWSSEIGVDVTRS